LTTGKPNLWSGQNSETAIFTQKKKKINNSNNYRKKKSMDYNKKICKKYTYYERVYYITKKKNYGFLKLSRGKTAV